MQSILDTSNRTDAVSSLSSDKVRSSESTLSQVDWLGIIEKLYSALLFLLPFFFLPVTADPISVNKAYLTILISLLSLVLFFANGIQKRKLSILNIESYIGIFILAIAAIVTTFFSINKNNSAFGHFGNYTDSLLFIVAVTFLGFVASNMRLDIKKLVTSFIAGTTIASILAIYVFYGFHIPSLNLATRIFSLAGSVYALLGLQVVAVLASLFYFLNTQSFRGRAFYIVSMIVNGAFLVSVANPESLAVLLAGLVILFLYVRQEINPGKRRVLAGIVLALGLIAFVSQYPMTREALNLKDVSIPERLPVRESWIIAADVIKNYPLQGAGVGTFINVYSMYRPASMNQTVNWNARFETPYSDLFLWLAAAGLTGLAAYAIFIGYSLYTVKSLRKGEIQSGLLTLAIPTMLLVLLVLGSNPVIYALLFVALGVAIQRSERKQLTINTTSVISVFALLALGMLIYTAYNASRVYAGQYFFRESLTKPNLAERYDLQSKAVNADMTESVYQRSYISTGIAIASAVSTKQDLTDTEKQEVLRILQEAFNNIIYMTEKFEPNNVLNWSLRGDLYASIMDLDQTAGSNALAAYDRAAALESTNPDNYINLGSVYYRAKAYNQAISAYVRAVQLKDDYANARYNLAYALKDAGYLVDAATQMEVVARLVPSGTPDYDKAKKEADDFKKAADDAIAKAQQNAAPKEVSTIDNSTAGPEKPTSKPLVNPQDQPESKLESNSKIEGDVKNLNKESSDEKLPASDGSQPDESKGEKEAPIANP